MTEDDHRKHLHEVERQECEKKCAYPYCPLRLNEVRDDRTGEMNFGGLDEEAASPYPRNK